jgi:acyl dehydratase
MNFNDEPVFVGRRFPGREVALDRERIDRYCDALETAHPLYADYSTALLLHSECYEDLSWYLANIYGNLHARQEWEMFTALAVGSRVRTPAFIRERYRKRGRDYVVKETWQLDETGGLCVRGITHQSFLAASEDAGQPREVVSKDRERSAGRSFDVEPAGTPSAPLTRTVTERMCMAFSGPTENYHTNRDAARALGFPDIVVQGMLPICLISELLTRDYGAGWLAGGRLDVRLVNVLWADETVHAGAQAVARVPEADRVRVHLDVWVSKDDGTKVIVGKASALEPA